MGVPKKGLMQAQRDLLLPSHGMDVARVARAEMRTKQKTPFAAIIPLKWFLRGDLRLVEAKAGLVRTMAVAAFLNPWQLETEISLAPDSVNWVIPLARETIWKLPLWPPPVEPGRRGWCTRAGGDSIAPDSVNGVFPSYHLPPAWRPSLTLPWRQQSRVEKSVLAFYGGFSCVSPNTGTYVLLCHLLVQPDRRGCCN